MVGNKIKIKKGDKVIMLKGKDLGKSGKVLKVYPAKQRLVVEGINLIKKNLRPKKQGEKGQVVSIPGAVRIENVQVVCSSCHKPTRVSFELKGDKRERHCKKCNAKI